MLAHGVVPDVQAEPLRGQRDQKKRSPLAPDPERGRGGRLPGARPRDAGVYPPGSTFKPVTALAAIEEHILVAVRRAAVHGLVHVDKPEVQQLGPVRGPADDDADRARRLLRHVLLPGRQRFYDLPADRGQPLQAWAKRFGFGAADRASTSACEATGLLPTIAWRHATYTKKTDQNWRSTGSGSRATRSSSRSARRTSPVTPLQMARFYALIANGGKLVTPHVVDDVEQPAGSNGAPQVAQSLRRRQPPRRRSTSTRRRSTVDPRRALPGDPREFGTAPRASSATTRSRSRARRARPRSTSVPSTAPAARPVVVVRLRAGDEPAIVVCALIENGGHGGTAAAPAALKVFEQYFGQGGRRRENRRPTDDGRLRSRQTLQAPPSAPVGARSTYLRDLDWVLLGRGRRDVAYGLWAIAGITRHDIPGNPGYYVVRQGVYAAVGVRRARRAALRRSRLLRRHSSGRSTA